LTQPNEAAVHSYYLHAEEAYSLIPAAAEELSRLKRAFERAGEDFIAIELKSMISRLEEIRMHLAEGPQG
jgi:hypothetical protein